MKKIDIIKCEIGDIKTRLMYTCYGEGPKDEGLRDSLINRLEQLRIKLKQEEGEN